MHVLIIYCINIQNFNHIDFGEINLLSRNILCSKSNKAFSHLSKIQRIKPALCFSIWVIILIHYSHQTFKKIHRVWEYFLFFYKNHYFFIIFHKCKMNSYSNQSIHVSWMHEKWSIVSNEAVITWFMTHTRIYSITFKNQD